ncbi:unnamed protein product [Adineta steineri]|uniref:Uncharacterized protein n=1 Tax=Adineta steineri TaxID=433720 RepID=A0A813UE09_9BILA|nr:unnamed protein product [Adineta steineri]
MSSVNQESNVLHDSYGSYTPSPPLPPVPPFPCTVDSLCKILCSHFFPFIFEVELDSYSNFFHLYGKIPPTPPPIVTTFQEFYYNLTQRFSFYKIAPFIDFNLFSLLGGSVLMSILRDVPETMTSDLDFFYVGHSFNNFIQTIRTIQRNLANIYFTKNTILSRERVYQTELILCTTIRELIQESASQKKIILQFIYHPKIFSIETYLMAFDLDIAQIAYNGREVVCTWAWIRSINTGTFICYNLTNNIYTLKRAAVRIEKYSQRGFKFLYPHGFEMDNFLSLTFNEINANEANNYVSSPEQFGESNDYFQLQKKFVDTYLNQQF